MLQRGLNAPTLAEEEAAWTAVIDAYGRSTAPWADDVVGRALGNRGNARSRQVCQPARSTHICVLGLLPSMCGC
jgi:hypothetical protein